MKRTSLVMILLAGCGDDGGDSTDPIDAAAIDAAPPAFAHTFADVTVQPGEEQLGRCRSVTLDNPTELLVNAVTLTQNEALRASAWYVVPETSFTGPDGDWSCTSRMFSGVAALAAGGALLYRQSVDAPTETQQLGPDVAIRVPPRARLVADVHRLNASAATVTGRTTIELRTLPSAPTLVTPVLASYRGLAIPPFATSRFSGTCAIPVDRLHYIQPNARGLAIRVFAEISGGPADGTSLLDASGPIPGGPRGRTVSPPVDLSQATGIHFGCEYTNPRDVTVQWGSGDQEMCDVLAFVEAPAITEGSIGTAEPAGMDGATVLFTGPCGVVP